MKKLFALILAIFLLLSMTSCAGLSKGLESVSDFLTNTVPNAIANKTKREFMSADNGLPSDNSQPSNTNSQEGTNGNSNISNNESPSSSPSSPSQSNGGADLATIINNITTNTIKACVNIRIDEFNTSPNNPLKSSIGSGVIFKAEKIYNGYHYYVLTNYHVVEPSGSYKYYNYTVTDHKGIEYKTETPNFTDNNNILNLCKENDLAILEFETTAELNVITMDTKNPSVDETIFSIGQPKGQQNTFTVGKISGYTDISVQGGFSPSFKSIAHTSPIDHGNSGGAILNTSLKLAGINFAGSWNDDNTFAYGYGIPIETVRQFIISNGISL